MNTSFQGLPPCLLIAAELDRFRDDSYGMNEKIFDNVHHVCFCSVEYQKLLEKDGVQTKLVLIKGVIHGYFGPPGKKLKRCLYFIINFYFLFRNFSASM